MNKNYKYADKNKKNIKFAKKINISEEINNKTNKETSSFLKTIQSTELDISQLNDTNDNKNIKYKQIEEIMSNYLDLKKKINLLWNKID